MTIAHLLHYSSSEHICKDYLSVEAWPCPEYDDGVQGDQHLGHGRSNRPQARVGRPPSSRR